MTVVDASVVYKWLVNEGGDDLPAAQKLRNRYVLGQEKVIAPDLLLYEIANIIVHQTKLPSLNIDEIWQNFSALKLPVTYANLDFIDKCRKYAEQYKISVYDAAYIVLASLNKCNLITADKKLVDRVNLPFVRLLGAE